MSGDNPSFQEPMHIDSDEVSQVPTSCSTDTRMARSDRSVPGLPPGIFTRGNMRRTASQQSQASETPTIPAALDSRLQRMDRVLSLFDPNIRQSSDAQHLSYNALQQALRIGATELDRTRGEIRFSNTIHWNKVIQYRWRDYSNGDSIGNATNGF